MRKVAGLALLGVGLVTLSGCKRQVPDDIVRKTMTSAVRMHAAGLVSVMCGGTTKGLTNPVVTVTKKNPDGSTGTAHVRGGPLFFFAFGGQLRRANRGITAALVATGE